MSEKNKDLTEEKEADKEFEKQCELVKKQLQKMEREAKKPIPRRILEMKFDI